MGFGEVEENKQASLGWALRLASVVCLWLLQGLGLLTLSFNNVTLRVRVHNCLYLIAQNTDPECQYKGVLC
jgi:hypothetical protein